MSNEGRPIRGKEKLEERISIYFSPTMAETLKSAPEGASQFVRASVQERLEKELETPDEETFDAIPLLGYIPASPAAAVRLMPHGTHWHPPYAVPANSYALLVEGDSMTTEYENSIPDGSYAIFAPDRMPAFNSIVHVEWEEGDHVCTLKRYLPQADGSAIFEPLNKSHKPIKRKANEFHIKGVFLRAWKDSDE